MKTWYSRCIVLVVILCCMAPAMAQNREKQTRFTDLFDLDNCPCFTVAWLMRNGHEMDSWTETPTEFIITGEEGNFTTTNMIANQNDRGEGYVCFSEMIGFSTTRIPNLKQKDLKSCVDVLEYTRLIGLHFRNVTTIGRRNYVGQFEY